MLLFPRITKGMRPAERRELSNSGFIVDCMSTVLLPGFKVRFGISDVPMSVLLV
jgi:hypothetical protein